MLVVHSVMPQTQVCPHSKYLPLTNADSHQVLTPLCGNFQSSCTTDAQCAFNTCNGGLCNGIIATTSTQPAAPKPTGTNLPLGAACDPALAGACANGVNCYASNYMLMPRCGNTQATCSRDDQCAYQNCLGGICSGPPVESKTATTMAAPTTTSMAGPAKPTGTNLPLGAPCDASLPNVCANGVNCYATNSMLIPQCGNFQASCRTNADCAYNTCNGGLCNGFLPSSAFPSVTVTASNPILTTSRTVPTAGSNVTMSGSPTKAPSATATPPLEANGAGKIEGGVVGLLGLIFAALLL